MRILLIVLAILIPHPTKAQASEDSILISYLTQARSAGKVIRLTGADTTHGRITQVSSDAVRGSGWQMNLSDIRSVEERRRSGGSGKMGAAFGFGVVFAASWIAIAGNRQNVESGEIYLMTLLSAVIGAPLGAAIGAHAGGRDTWVHVWSKQ